MKEHFVTAGVVLLLGGWVSNPSIMQGQAPAFPGALGFGANASGGRGGSVYHVTTLADSGTGSFRDAVSQPNRIVVFDVGGYITINSEVAVQSHITIAGQTAPGGGIGIKGREVSFGSQQNIICRHVRFRPGSDSNSTDNGVNLYRAENIILDHVSIEFAKWNNIGGVSDDWQNHPVQNITFQNCIIGNPIYQQFGAHTECVDGTWSWFYNIFANSHNRNPMSKINDVFVNNIAYNCSAGYTTHTSTSFDHDIVNNYFIAGPASGGNFPWYQIDQNQSIYYSGNYYDGDQDGLLGGGITTPYWYQGAGTILPSPWSPVTTSVPLYKARHAYAVVISRAGAMPRDEMDDLLISQVQTLGNGPVGTGAGTAGPDGGLYTSQTQTGLGNNGFGTIASGSVPEDTDQDGLPDYYETSIGSDETVPNQNAAVQPGAFVPTAPAGYTLIDDYLHFKAGPHVVVGLNGTTNVDLTDYSAGFAPSASLYTVVSSNNLSTILQPDGHTVQLIPPADYVGRAEFEFRVQQGIAFVMTQQVLVVVSGAFAEPSAPTNLTATAISSGEIVLEWTDTSPNESGFMIERASGGGGFTEIASVPADSTGFTNLVAPDTTYDYRVRAYNLSGESAYSNTDTAATPIGPPSPPTVPVAAPGNSRVSVNWQASPGATAYRVKRALAAGGPYTTLATFDGTSFDDLYAVNGTTYFYVVTALNGDGESAASSYVSAIPSSTVTYPAEYEAYGNGAIFEDKNAGFHDTGYVNASTDVGSYVQFNGVDGGGGGSVTLRFRNALGSNTARTGSLAVNGSMTPITFDSTGTWTTWVNKDVVATLNPGSVNTIRLESTGQDLANIDELTVFGTAVTPPPASPLFDEVNNTDGELVANGFGGLPYATYRILTSTDASAEPGTWTAVETNSLDANGAFVFTNVIESATPWRFFRIELPE
jgi:hypothetical protein